LKIFFIFGSIQGDELEICDMILLNDLGGTAIVKIGRTIEKESL
jgi:hypothetical protein